MRLFAALALLALPTLARADEKPKLEIELTAPKEIYPDEALKVTAAIRNAGKEDAHVLVAVDGALDGLRGLVTYKWSAKKNGQAVPRRTDIVRIDNMVNTIGAEDLVEVKPGKVMNPQVGAFTTYYNLNTPGKYSITLTYDFDPTANDKVASPELLKKLQKFPPAVAKGEVEVSIIPFPPAIAAVQDKLKAAEARHQLVMQFAELTAKNPNATAVERDEAAERLKRASAARDEAANDYNSKMAEFRKKREEERNKK